MKLSKNGIVRDVTNPIQINAFLSSGWTEAKGGEDVVTELQKKQRDMARLGIKTEPVQTEAVEPEKEVAEVEPEAQEATETATEQVEAVEQVEGAQTEPEVEPEPEPVKRSRKKKTFYEPEAEA